MEHKKLTSLSGLSALDRAIRHGRNTRQKLIGRWICLTWGRANLVSRQERALRVLEEAIELAQAEGIAKGLIGAITDFVYKKPPGEPFQEIGGVALTLMAYAEAAEVSLDDLETAEMARALNLPIEKLQAKHALKLEGGVSFPIA